MAAEKVEKQLLDVGDPVSIKKTVLEGAVKNLAILEGKVAYLVAYEEDGESHERFFFRDQLVLKEVEGE